MNKNTQFLAYLMPELLAVRPPHPVCPEYHSQQTNIDYLLCAEHCVKCWGHDSG